MKKIFFLIVLFFLSTLLVISQIQSPLKKIQNDTIVIEVFKGDSIISTSKISHKSRIEEISENRCIVEFDTPPLNLKQVQKAKNLKVINQVDQIHKRFKKDLSALRTNNKNSKRKNIQIKNSFRITITSLRESARWVSFTIISAAQPSIRNRWLASSNHRSCTP